MERDARRQERLIAFGEWQLKTFPFLRGPTEWLVRQLEKGGL
jgi:hypothetical protein